LILGILEKVSLADATISLAPGDALVLYTDGLTEAENPQGEEFGLTRLAAAIAAAPAEASALHAHVLAELAAFTASASQMDDITLLVVTSEL
jgi:sigma-B regulation protein RsbU (phosphoserine phosphatase)